MLLFIEYMLLRITERQVIYLLRKKRRIPSESRKVEKLPDGRTIYSGSNMADYMRRTYGLERNQFENELYFSEFGGSFLIGFLKRLQIKSRPVYFEHFTTELREIIDGCIAKGYIKISKRQEGIFLKEDLEYARKLLSIWYYPRILIEYEPVRELIKEAIKWLVIAFLGYVGISQTISVVLNSRS